MRAENLAVRDRPRAPCSGILVLDLRNLYSDKRIIIASKFRPMRQQILTPGQILVNDLSAQDSSAIGDERRNASLRLVLEINRFLLGHFVVIRQRHRYHPAMIQDDPVGLGPTHNLVVAFSVE